MFDDASFDVSAFSIDAFVFQLSEIASSIRRMFSVPVESRYYSVSLFP